MKQVKSMMLGTVLAVVIVLSGCSDSSESASTNNGPFTVTTDAFANDGQFDEQYTTADNRSIPLTWENAPKGTKSFAIIMVDLHPIANHWMHWVVTDIPAKVNNLPAGASRTDQMPEGAIELLATNGLKGYVRPMPPGTADHEYKVIVFALDVKKLDAPKYVDYNKFMDLVQGHIIDQAEISGFKHG